VVITTAISDLALNGDPIKTTYSASTPVTSWTVNVTETQTAPSVTNVELRVGAPTATIISEGITNANVSFDVTDAECDNFKYTVEFQVMVSGTMTTIFQPFTNVVVNRTDCSPLQTSVTTANIVIPQYLNDPRNTTTAHIAAGQPMQIKVTVTDIPDTATAASSNFTQTGLTIVDTNPVTINSGVLNPLLAATNVIQAGSMFTIDPGNLSSGNTSAAPDVQNALFSASTYAVSGALTLFNTNQGNKIIYQWQVAATNIGDCSISVYNNIPGAGLSTPASGPVNPKLVWTPPRQNGSNTYCFRLCVGDDGFNHPATCTGTSTVVGPWIGTPLPGLNDFAATPPNVEKTIHAGTTSNPHLASFQSTTGLVNYTAMADGFDIRVLKSVYSAATGTITSTSGVAVSDGAALTNDAPINFSIAGTGDDTTGKVYVAYQILDGDGYAPFFYNVIRVRCFTRGTMAQDCGSWNYDEITSKIGNISLDGSNWYLPFIDIDDGYKVSLIWTELSNTTTTVTLGEAANNIRERLFSTYTANSSASVIGFTDPTNNIYSMVVENSGSGNDLITYHTNGVGGIATGAFAEASAYISLADSQDIFPANATRFTGVIGTTRLFLGALSSTGQFLLRKVSLGGTYTVDPTTYTFSGLNADSNSAINLGFYNNTGGDGVQSPIFTFGNGANGNITYYKVNYPISSGVISTSLTASKQTINSTAGTFGGDNGKLSTTLSYPVQIGVNGSSAAQTPLTNWVTYSSGVNIYQGIVNLDPFAAVANSVTTTNLSDGTSIGVGVPFW
jgi:hypothetical protein